MRKYPYLMMTLLLAVQLVFALSGCGSSGGGGGGSYRVSKVEVDDDANGTMNRIITNVYNSSGALVNTTEATATYVVLYKNGPHGVTNRLSYNSNSTSQYPSTSYYTTYYPSGEKKTYRNTSYDSFTGAITSNSETTYDTDGHIILQWTDVDKDETVSSGDNFISYTWENGNKTAQQNWTSGDSNTTYDPGTDTRTQNFEWTYDIDGNQILYWMDSNPFNGTKEAGDRFQSFTYVGETRATKMWTSGDTNSIYNAGTDSLTYNDEYTYDSDGNTVFYWIDEDIDEAISLDDTFSSTTYVNGLRTSRKIWTSQDTNNIYNSGTDLLTYNQENTYDIDGNKTLVWDDTDESEDFSIGDYFTAYTWSDGLKKSEMKWLSDDADDAYNGTDSIQYNFGWSHDTNGNATMYWEDIDGSTDVSPGDTLASYTYDSSGNMTTNDAWTSGDTNTTYDAGTDTYLERNTYSYSKCSIMYEGEPESGATDNDGDGSYELFYYSTYDSACLPTLMVAGTNDSIEHYFYNATGIIGMEEDNDYTTTDTPGDVTTTATYDPTCKDFASVVEDETGSDITGEDFIYDGDCDESMIIEWTDGNANSAYDVGEADQFTAFSIDYIAGTFKIEKDPDTLYSMGDTALENTTTYTFVTGEIVNSETYWLDADGSGAIDAGDTVSGTILTLNGSQVVNALMWSDGDNSGAYEVGEEVAVASYSYSGGMINGLVYDDNANGTPDPTDYTALYTFTGSRVATYARWADKNGDGIVNTTETTGANFAYGSCGLSTRTDWTDEGTDGFTKDTDETVIETWTCEAGSKTAGPPEGEGWSLVELPELPAYDY